MSALLDGRNMQHMGSNLSRYLVVLQNLSVFMACLIITLKISKEKVYIPSNTTK
jgi:hypothetical protein